jgi:hypothetical protein
MVFVEKKNNGAVSLRLMEGKKKLGKRDERRRIVIQQQNG